jgi:hypothetical protein
VFRARLGDGGLDEVGAGEFLADVPLEARRVPPGGEAFVDVERGEVVGEELLV